VQNNVIIILRREVMDRTLQDLWWVPVTRGISAIVFGIIVLVWPAASVGIVALLFASLIAFYGITTIIVGVQSLTQNMGGILRVLLGVLEIGTSIYLFKNAGTGLTLEVMGLLMSINLVILAIVMVGASLMNDASAGYRWAMAIIGAITLFVGITVARAPAISIATVIIALGIFGLFTGPVEVASGFMLKNKK
jgi:uncharacterized membrane protein HdeD (DUF308 family)